MRLIQLEEISTVKNFFGKTYRRKMTMTEEGYVINWTDDLDYQVTDRKAAKLEKEYLREHDKMVRHLGEQVDKKGAKQ